MSGLSLHDTVKVKNVAPPQHKYGDLTIFHGPAIRVNIKSGEEAMVPYYIAKNWFGDARSGANLTTHLESTDNGPRTAIIPTREFEVARLHAHYGVHSGPSDRFEAKDVPQVELYDLEGNRIPTVLEDPEGNNVIEAKPTVTQMSTLMAQMEAMRAELNALKAEKGEEAPELVPEEEDETLSELPTDDVSV